VHISYRSPPGYNWPIHIQEKSPARGLHTVSGSNGSGAGSDQLAQVGELVQSPFHLGLVLGKVPVRISRNKSHKYRVFGPIIVPPIPSK